MTMMLKGYNIPRPGPGDGEYGGFSGFAAYAQSPANHAYWQGQGIARTIPALNGFGYGINSDDFYTDRRGKRVYIPRHSRSGAVHGYGADPSIELPALTPKTAAIAAAAAGFLTEGARRGAIWGVLAYLVVDKFVAPVSGYGDSIPGTSNPIDVSGNTADGRTVGEDPSLDAVRQTAADIKALYTTGTNGSTSPDSFTLGPVAEGAMPPSGPALTPGKIIFGLVAARIAWKFIF